MNKKYILVLITLITVLSGQAQNKEMTIKEMIKGTSKYVKHYSHEPIYYLEIRSNASFIVKVNDMPTANYFGLPQDGRTYPLNDDILQSGVQKISIALYPSYTDKKTQAEFLNNDATLSIIITERFWDEDDELSEPKILATYNLQNIDLSEKTEYKDSLTFKAEVPYNLTGWSKSKDLSQMDRKELEEKVVAFYTQFHSWYQNKEDIKILNSEYNRSLELSQANYVDKKGIEKQKNGLSSFFAENEFTLEPLENYEIQFFGNGRMVALIRTDNRNRGESALRIKYTNKSGFRRVSIPSLLLHIPENGEELEVIR